MTFDQVVEALKVSAGPIALTWNILNALSAGYWRRQRRKLGAASEDIRAALVYARTLFEDVSASPREVKWFVEDAQRRDAESAVRDQIDRVSDELLRGQLEGVAGQLRLVFAWASGYETAPGEGGFWDKVGMRVTRQAQQFDHAQIGLAAVETARARLNILEIKGA
ncbi:hypothetical protein ABGB12_27950 [Actinocorallia sp. B10E7]|uniref:hypothetical protein n=1 Tax=Actinocorallia sp. B10E7 TaxID=3153558 RepID=UPI00325C44CF